MCSTHTESMFVLTDNIHLSDAGKCVFYLHACPQAPEPAVIRWPSVYYVQQSSLAPVIESLSLVQERSGSINQHTSGQSLEQLSF